VERTLVYVQDGLHVHLSGPAGSGKTTVALHVAHQLGRPVLLIHGDDQMGTADLVGKESGYKRSYTRDEYVHTVLKVERVQAFVGGRVPHRGLPERLHRGYDEFTRSRPAPTMCFFQSWRSGCCPCRGEHIAVHPDFRIIFTSNPPTTRGSTAPKMLSGPNGYDPPERV